MFLSRMVGIVKIDIEWIIKDSFRFVKADSVPGKICGGLGFVPFKCHDVLS